MKKLLLALTLGVSIGIAQAQTAAPAAADAPKTKQVCTDVKGSNGQVVKNKDGSNKQTCKTIKVHKKYEGTAVPKK
jgi:outer membrane lipoprotein-sorting protein